MSYTARDVSDVRLAVLLDFAQNVDGQVSSSPPRSDGPSSRFALERRRVLDDLDLIARERLAVTQGMEHAVSHDADDRDLRRAIARKRLEGLDASERVALAALDDVERARARESRDTNGERMAIDGHRAKKERSTLRDDHESFFAELDDKRRNATETERERLIRSGAITPFDSLGGYDRALKAQEVGERARATNATMKASRARIRGIEIEDAPRARAEAKPFATRGLRMRESVDQGRRMKEKRAEWRGKMRENDVKRDGGKDGRRGKRRRRGSASEEEDVESDDGGGFGTSDDDRDDVEFDGGMSIPGDVYARLLAHQKTGLKWLWELHCQRAGGIIGDEMGLGKTVQVASFLGALHHSNMYSPSVVVCPATMLRQWRRELRIWAPLLRATILHDSALGAASGARGKKQARERAFNDCISDGAGILITTYEHLRLFRDRILAVRWGYAILDEGHKIRNPDADITIVAKQLQTVHRIVMSGAPIQNRLSELWSLFDFVFPGKLGTLPVFQAQFAVPIQFGGYTNASNQQVTTAFQCAVTLKDLIAPYLLRRMKCDVDVKLPEKTEQVLFCPMTSEQRAEYRAYLASREVEDILDGTREALGGIDVLRKIVNHPDLLERRARAASAEYGEESRSGKLQVTLKILAAWREQGHRCLVFSQTQQMLDIIESAVANAGYSYRRMDGNTSIASRMSLIDEFNDDERGVFAFLLTTKVGGLGVNLTGANRVLLFDPDWNPSTDAQARERAWRIGQKKEVTVYRLITAGTIEEKVYHRQIYKEFLTSKVLKDPKQRRFFKARDMADLFTFDEVAAGGGTGADAKASNETVELFAEVEGQIRRGDVDIDDNDVKDEDGEIECEDDAWDPENTTADAPRPKLPSRTNSSGHIRIEEARASESKPGDNGAGDAAILRNLFDSDNIHVAMNHDKIMSAAGVDRMAYNAEAERVARRAAEALRLSARASRGDAGVHVPTWTGTRGAAGGPHRPLAPAVARSVGRFGRTSANASDAAPAATSSRALLSRIAARREESARAVETDLSSAQLDEEQANELMRDIIIFLKSRGGRAPTGLVIDAFQDRVRTHQHALFRQLLKLAATLERNPSRREGAGSSWVLKPEFTVD